MKKRVLVSSLVTIALCICLIAGSTFALFTDTTDFNIAVTSGDVEVVASAAVKARYSAVKTTDSRLSDEFLVDEFGRFYTHAEQTDTFLNGGTAEVVNGAVEIERITPGDRVDINISIDNRSDVAIAYRYKIVASNTNLATGMVVTTFDMQGNPVATEGLAIWTSDWYFADAVGGTPETILDKTISIELPVYAGNEYQTEKEDQEDGRLAETQTVSYTVIVEAVQGNAGLQGEVENEEKFVVFQNEAVEDVTPELNSDYFERPTNAAYIHELYLRGDANIKIDQNGAFVIENVTTNVNGGAIVYETGNSPAIIISNCNFILDDGEVIIDASALTSPATQIFLENVRVNGELLPIGVCDPAIAQYFQNVGWYQVVDPNVES